MRAPAPRLACALAAFLAAAAPARAQVDGFGVGDGADGSKATLSGDINRVAAIVGDVSVGATSVTFADEAGQGSFGAGDLVMLWQPTGLAAEPPPNQALTSLV